MHSHKLSSGSYYMYNSYLRTSRCQDTQLLLYQKYRISYIYTLTTTLSVAPFQFEQVMCQPQRVMLPSMKYEDVLQHVTEQFTPPGTKDYCVDQIVAIDFDCRVYTLYYIAIYIYYIYTFFILQFIWCIHYILCGCQGLDYSCTLHICNLVGGASFGYLTPTDETVDLETSKRFQPAVYQDKSNVQEAFQYAFRPQTNQPSCAHARRRYAMQTYQLCEFTVYTMG